MSKTINSRTLSPLALTLLVAATGCTLDQSQEPTDTISDAGPSLYLSVSADDARITAAPAVASRANDRGLSLRDTSAKPTPPSPQLEGEAKNGEEEVEEVEEVETPEKSGPTHPDDEVTLPVPEAKERNVAELPEVQLRGLVDAVIFATPARLAAQLDDANFTDFDVAGAITTSKQGLSGCTTHSVSREENSLHIQFACQALGDNAPTGEIFCEPDFSNPDAVGLNCDAKLQSNLGAVRGEIVVEYEVAADVAAVDAKFRAPNETRIEGRYAIEGVASATQAISCQTQHGSVLVARQDRTRIAQFKGVERCDNNCRPELGTLIFDMFEPLSDDGSQIVLTGRTAGWSATNESMAAVVLPLCQ